MNRRKFLGTTAAAGAAFVAKPYIGHAAKHELLVAEPVHSTGYLPMYIAMAKDYFAEADINVKIVTIETGSGHTNAVLSGQAFANSSKPGIQSACWDLRVQPAPAPPPAGRGERGRGPAEGGRGAAPETPSPVGAGCPPIPTAAGGDGGGFGFGTQTNGPLVIGGTYNVALVIDGKTIETRPLKVADDPDVVLTSADRKRQYDMAMVVTRHKRANLRHELRPLGARADQAHLAAKHVPQLRQLVYM